MAAKAKLSGIDIKMKRKERRGANVAPPVMGQKGWGSAAGRGPTGTLQVACCEQLKPLGCSRDVIQADLPERGVGLAQSPGKAT